jgi:hypothetical protein
MWHYHHHIVHVTLSSSHRPRDIIIITSSTWHYHHHIVHVTLSSSHRPRVIIITSSMWHYHHHIVHVTLSSSHRPRDIIIITSSTWHYHHSTARYFKFKYRCQNIFLQPWKLLRILQNNDAISHYKKYGRNDYGRTGLWTNRLESLLYAACTKRRFTSITIHVNCQYKFVLSYIFIHWLWGHRGRDRMVVGFTTAYAISAYHQ